MERVVDAVIVGAGVAGLSAALFLGRAGRSAIIFDGGTTRIESVAEVREYLGFDGLPPRSCLPEPALRSNNTGSRSYASE
ncbi:FAD-binding protein (plasmid) [Sinorhizobium sp. K101]|uniref:FAD-binding protein n=1 Tax=unclassified Sinorhizobium TaxID=2613772 RepID=UPI0023D7E705|nr:MULTISPECIES: FAD-binding protein [unclassified Sinorhizobium]WEJ13235.1 FAD-binding protein [Sinorhizobium sp. M103]WEJ18323.1 FAD-binding protein [Sinorhizobium sp. K101]